MAVSPQAPVTNWFIGGDFHHNGAFFIMDAFSFYSPMGMGFDLPHPQPTNFLPVKIDYLKYGRKKSILAHIFLYTRAPYAPLTGDAVSASISHLIEVSGVDTS